MARQDEYVKTQLRLPRDLHARISGAAEKAGRSLNAELIGRLQRSFEPTQVSLLFDESIPPEAINDGLRRLADALASLGGKTRRK